MSQDMMASRRGEVQMDDMAIMTETLRVKDEELQNLARELRSRDSTIKELAEKLSETAEAAEHYFGHTASKKQLEGFISSLHGHVASLFRHMVGSVVIEHAFHLANASQKQSLLVELYSTELQLFKDLVSTKEGRLVNIIAKLGLQNASVQRHMASVIHPIQEKGIVDHSIIHSALLEYFGIADKM